MSVANSVSRVWWWWWCGVCLLINLAEIEMSYPDVLVREERSSGGGVELVSGQGEGGGGAGGGGGHIRVTFKSPAKLRDHESLRYYLHFYI